MRTLRTIAIVMLTLGTGAFVAQQNESASVQLKAAIHRETIDGDLPGAIVAYKKIVERYPAERAIVANALLHMAECHRKLGEAEARTILERLIRDYADQQDVIVQARAKLGGSERAPRAETALTARRVWTGAGADGTGSPSPDGRYLSFTDWETGDLAVRDLVAGTNRRLTSTGGWAASGDYAQDAVFSPDGRQIAYTWFVQKDRRNELRILPLAASDAGRARLVVRTEQSEYLSPFAWTPDASQLAVLRSQPDKNVQIGFVSIQTGSFRSVKSLEWRMPSYRGISLSPDGRYIAYDGPAGDQGSPRDIFVLAADGSGEATAVQGPADDSLPVWQPDGSRVLFLSNRTGTYGLWAVPIDRGKAAGAPVLVKPDLNSMLPIGMTRAGALNYVINGGTRTNIYSADLGASPAAAPALLSEHYVNANVGPAWARDGQSLAYYSYRGGNRNNPPTVVIRSSTGVERTVTSAMPLFSPFQAGPQWFSDGRSLLALARDKQGAGFGFYRMRLEDGAMDLLHHETDYPSSVALAGDGRAFFYTLQQIGGKRDSGRLVRVDVESRRETVLRQNEWFITVAVSPDGRRLAYVRSIGNGQTLIATVPADGGEAVEIYRAADWDDGSRYNALTWTPDGRSVLFVRGGVVLQSPNTIWRVPIAGGAAERVGISMPMRIKNLSVRSDGRELLFSAADSENNEIWVLENIPTAVDGAKQSAKK